MEKEGLNQNSCFSEEKIKTICLNYVVDSREEKERTDRVHLWNTNLPI